MSGKKQAIICDIDGCLIDTRWIWGEVEKQGLNGDKMWEFFHKHANDIKKSKIQENLLNILRAVNTEICDVVFLTARSEEIKFDTVVILKSCLPNASIKLYMRPIGNTDPSDIFKESIFAKIKKEHDIILAIDDEEPNCSMFRKNGITTIKWDIEKMRNKTEGMQACVI